MSSARGESDLWTAILLILLGLGASTSAQKQEEKKVLLQLDSLPEPFTNSKLGGDAAATRQDDSQRCYNLIGCFEKIPIMSLPQDPKDLKTEFRIYNSHDEEVLAAIDSYQVCLASKPSECDRYPFDLQQLLTSPFDVRRRTIVVIGGYFSKAPSKWELRVKELWSRLANVNVIIVSWTGGNSGLYTTASINTRPVARQLTVLLYYLARLRGMQLAEPEFGGKIYIVGHSLGAHIAGFVGQDLGGQLGRITGLDPAGPQFDTLPRNFRLDKSDAQLVDIMHTNAGSTVFSLNSRYGSALTSGHVDFYANDGSHQPGCSVDILGCSHKKANAYYESYLNHELSMRSYVKCRDCRAYRLRAYASDSYEQFHNGLGLKRGCPISVLDDNDLIYSDLDKCSIPIDYVTWADELREELRTRNGIHFNRSTSETNGTKYFYYSSDITDDQTDHYLLKIRMSKYDAAVTRKQKIDSSPQGNLVGCDFNLDFETANGKGNKYVISKYQPIDENDHFMIIFPFLSPNFVSKYELAKLDANNFYLSKNKNGSDQPGELDKLRASLGKVLPLSIKVLGLSSEENDESVNNQLQPKKKNSIVSFMKRLFGMAKGGGSDEKNEGGKGKPVDPRCSLPIESITVQPLRKIHRHLAAVYSPHRLAKPDVIVLKSLDEKAPKIEFIQETATATNDTQPEASSGDGSSILYKHTVIIGPFDGSIDIEQNDSVEEQEDSRKARRSVGPNVSLVSANAWLVVSVSSSLMIILVVIIAIMSKAKPAASADDKQKLVVEAQTFAQADSELVDLGQRKI